MTPQTLAEPTKLAASTLTLENVHACACTHAARRGSEM